MRLLAGGAVLFLVAFICTQKVSAQVEGTQGITSVFSTGAQEIAAYDATSRQLRFFSVAGETAKEIASISVPGQVMGVVALDDSYVVATGMGRGDLTPPIRVHLLPKSELSNKKNLQLKVVFERQSERPQITQLRLCGNSVWFGFLESKYNTVIGELKPSSTAAGAAWSFAQRVGLRMGDSFDCVGDAVAVGRSYGDAQGQDGDLLLMRGNERTLLPSYRGVRGVESVGDTEEQMLAIGDGWHSNYGEMAQGRVSLLRKRKGEQRFALEILDLDSKNFNFTKFRRVNLGSQSHLVALGSSQILVYSDLLRQTKKQSVYTQVGRSHLLDFALATTGANELTLAVADEGLRLIKVAIP